MAKTTIKDLSNYTGLSLGTISKFINGGKVRPQNQAIIEEAISALNFNVNEFARGLRTKRSRTIGVIIPSLENFFSTTLVAYIESELFKQGYSVMVCAYQESGERERQQLRFLVSKNVDAIVIVATNEFETARLVQEIIDNGTYVIAVDRKIPGAICDVVEINSFQISYEVTNYLIGQGHHDIGIICVSDKAITAIQRYQGYISALKDSHITKNDNFVGFGDNFSSGAYEYVKKVLSLENRPTAIFATNYDSTLGALMAINELGLRIPEDVSVVGFDNLAIAKVFKPTLTMVAQPMRDIAKKTVDKVLDKLERNIDVKEDVILNGYIVYGASVKKIT